MAEPAFFSGAPPPVMDSSGHEYIRPTIIRVVTLPESEGLPPLQLPMIDLRADAHIHIVRPPAASACCCCAASLLAGRTTGDHVQRARFAPWTASGKRDTTTFAAVQRRASRGTSLQLADCSTRTTRATAHPSFSFISLPVPPAVRVCVAPFDSLSPLLP